LVEGLLVGEAAVLGVCLVAAEEELLLGSAVPLEPGAEGLGAGECAGGRSSRCGAIVSCHRRSLPRLAAAHRSGPSAALRSFSPDRVSGCRCRPSAASRAPGARVTSRGTGPSASSAGRYRGALTPAAGRGPGRD